MKKNTKMTAHMSWMDISIILYVYLKMTQLKQWQEISFNLSLIKSPAGMEEGFWPNMSHSKECQQVCTPPKVLLQIHINENVWTYANKTFMNNIIVNLCHICHLLIWYLRLNNRGWRRYRRLDISWLCSKTSFCNIQNLPTLKDKIDKKNNY